ncbi:HAD-IC family P-type ATPase [Emticicia sp. CRIBPO]|uniref:cation-translocating P-type ATPase n=1 Tax=Emticicia sp. CRIBPO TaxID=2683258 RepID=UPI0014121B79|nr:cation-translocating P-type ATPase [Emticicia sp. CRIBPO]NBA85965.1 HAD-IC family P-type ATPase [Emticicia sp. CRIBPO]
MPENHFNIRGLDAAEVAESARKYGFNRSDYKKEYPVWEAVKSLVKEPMVILLLITSSIYFISGETGDGLFMASAIVLVSVISLYQDSRSRSALDKLKTFSQPLSKVIRDGVIVEILSEDIVSGDSMVIEEGSLIPADGIIVHSNDFSVNESILTGESMSVDKTADKEDPLVYHGTTVVSGLAVATVTAIGKDTRLGKIGKSLEEIKEEKTPLELQINNFVKKMVITGLVVFIIVWLINYWQNQKVVDSLLKALTLAMSILPEEIPVAFTTFMALGAWRLMKMGIVVKQMKTVETLGSATVICTDKTGTITENKMSLARLFTLKNNRISDIGKAFDNDEKDLVRMAMWSSEPHPFDPMETALHQAYSSSVTTDERPDYSLVHEYPLGGKPPMMTHVFENKTGNRIIAAKGAPEAIIKVCNLDEEQKRQIRQAIVTLAEEGLRLLGVAETRFEGINFPETQQEFRFDFKGLVAFYDPPKKNIASVLNAFYSAGIDVKIITGDNAATTTAIARQIGFKGYENSITGEELMKLPDETLKDKVMDFHLFTRMFPEAKLKIINALKARNQIVAMTGDGVNDGPALKAAHIGIAMGKKGTEIAKQAASLILADDDLSGMVDAVAMGRKIYNNLKKAIQYIISIHIPIILTVFIPLALGWVYPNIFSPVHIIFLELIMGPTCSIIYENEPMEKNTMMNKPRPFTDTFLNVRELLNSIVQGLMITAGTLLVYRYAVSQSYSEDTTRTMVFMTLISANVFLTLVNRSFYYSVLTSLTYKNNLIPLIILITVLLSCCLVLITPLARFFDFSNITWVQALVSAGSGFLFVIWYEALKWIKRINSKH